MSFESDLRAKLTGDPAVGPLVSQRVYPTALAQGSTLPALVYQWISAEREYSHDGVSNLALPRIQVSCFASTFAAAKDLAVKVRKALEGFRGTMGSTTVQASFCLDERDIFEPDVLMYRTDLDFQIWFTEV